MEKIKVYQYNEEEVIAILKQTEFKGKDFSDSLIIAFAPEIGFSEVLENSEVKFWWSRENFSNLLGE